MIPKELLSVSLFIELMRVFVNGFDVLLYSFSKKSASSLIDKL